MIDSLRVRASTWVAPVAVALVGLVLRLRDYTVVPYLQENHDEFAWAWSGLTLITRHVPYAWSYLPHYRDITRLSANGTTYPIVHPWFDHPPLFGLLVGGWAWLLGARQMMDVTLAQIRVVPIALSLATILLAFALARRVAGQPVALLACLLLATAPVAVAFAREAESEALLAPLLLLALLLTHRNLEGESRPWEMAVLVLCCALAPLTKVPGVAVGMAVVAVLLVRGRHGAAALAAGGTVAGVGAFALYGAAIDWRGFVATLSDQQARRTGLQGAYEFITRPAGLGRVTHDGWWVAGWIGLGALLARGRSATAVLVLPAMVYVTVIALLADEKNLPTYGWYRITIYPLVYIGAAEMAWRAISRRDATALLVVLLLGGATAAMAAFVTAGGWGRSAVVIATVLALAVIPVAALPRRGTWNTAAQTVALAAVLVVLALGGLEAGSLVTTYPLL